MAGIREIEMHAEVERWLKALDEADYARVEDAIDALVDLGERLRMPYSRALRGGLFELRIRLRDEQRRITYWFAPDARIVFLTTFRKQRQHEQREIA